MQQGRLRESLDHIASLVQQGQGIGYPLMNKDDFQQTVLWLLADIYLQLPQNTKSRSLRSEIQNALTLSGDEKRRKPKNLRP